MHVKIHKLKSLANQALYRNFCGGPATGLQLFLQMEGAAVCVLAELHRAAASVVCRLPLQQAPALNPPPQH